MSGEAKRAPADDLRWTRAVPGRTRTPVTVGSVTIGGEAVVLAAGPCAVEPGADLDALARDLAAAGASLLRGGAYKPRTSPYSFQGLGPEGLERLAAAGRAAGLPVVTEVLDPRDVDLVASHAAMLQLGSRSVQNVPLLREVGRSGKPVLLKRGMMTTVYEWLSAAEYVLEAAGGSAPVVLCERGIRTFEDATRNTLDLNAVALVRVLSHLPVVVDPSHGTGRADLVPDLCRAAVAVGADGLLVEVHPDPAHALSDGDQTLDVAAFAAMRRSCGPVAAAVGRTL
ncbi:MAG TPA: 3-deoxy-7-phosphoheptulonate synthase [Candidatus Krumholzibacteria bacterium]|nr:3-deoxy-7-phosphoheptulonate synthase [Candidatus Krumholzibacteria bacterium]HRX52045.1 3-deoxy-7-phosphoheptulonate synthase [Candidatus Krumholzibacteria bacterium]